MQRRNFMQKSVLAAGASLLTGAALKANPGKNDELKKEDEAFAGKPFNLNYAIHDGMFRENAGAD